MNDLLKAALIYARLGWHVFPLRSNAKAPATRNGHHDASADPEQIKAWWSTLPSANIGISLEPSGLVVLDVDTNDGKPGADSLATINAELPVTLSARTGRGGMHAVYRCTDAEQQGRKIGFLPGLDLLGKGYIVAAPSVVPEGSYRWLNTEQPIAPVPKRLDTIFGDPTPVASVSPDADIPDGMRHASLFRLACSLRHQGLSADALGLALMQTNVERCNPPLDDSSIVRIVESVSSYEPNADVAGVELLRAALFPTRPTEIAPRLGAIAKRPRKPKRVYTTFSPVLDEALGGGVRSRQAHTIAAPPGAGKTGLVVSMGLDFERKGAPVLHVSTELDDEEMLSRYDGNASSRSWAEIDRGTLEVSGLTNSKNIYAIGCDALPREPGKVVELIQKQVALITEAHDQPPIVIIDYLQDIVRGAGDDARRSVADLVKSLRSIAVSYDCVFIIVSSVSRAYYGGAALDRLREADDARVFLAAAKESGDVDFDSAVVLYLDVGDNGATRIAVAKARSGHPGRFVGARFNGETGAWRDDSSALGELEPEQRKARDSTKRDQHDDTTVLQRVRDLWTQGIKKPKAQLRELCGIPKQRTTNAIMRMLADGRLEIRAEMNERCHRFVDVVVPGEGVARAPPAMPSVTTALNPLTLEAPNPFTLLLGSR